MIKENTEPKDEQTTIITSPASTINHTVQQRTNNNNNNSTKWKQISLQGLDLSPQPSKITSTPPLNSSSQRVMSSFEQSSHHLFFKKFKSIRRTATIIHPNTMTTSSITNDPRRTLACNDITLPVNSNQTNSFFRRRTQQPKQQQITTTFNGQSDKSSSSIDDNLTKIPSTTFSLLRQHSSPTHPHTKIEKSTYDNLTTPTIHTDNITTTTTTTTNLERKSSFPLNKKSNRHATNDSLANDAYDNYPEKNGYDNYPIIRKANESEGNLIKIFSKKFNFYFFY